MALFDENGKLIDRNALKSVRFGSVFHGGYSHSTGTYVEGVKDMGEQLKAKADEMSERMGFECSYRISDASDSDTFGAHTADESQDILSDRKKTRAIATAEQAEQAAETPTSELVPE